MSKEDASEDIRELASKKWYFFALKQNKKRWKLYWVIF